ncbi:MAG: hypothetical protein EOP86_13095 [Verrucomicrobiaceae bacterium]|nr:MAG: hypothetical protein EOP86_13095 [Verrucomicrobiaceae bacterium]
MKFTPLPLLAALAGPVLLMTAPLTAQAAREDLTEVYRTGRNAFNKGDYVTAKAAFARLLKADPNFQLGKIYMAQIRHAEALWEARPLARKIVEKAKVGTVAFRSIPLSEALELVRRKVEQAGTGPNVGAIGLRTDLPAGVLDRPVSLSVKDVPMQWWIDAVAYAGGVRISLTQEGLSVTAGSVITDPKDKAFMDAMLKMKQQAQERILTRMAMDHASLEEALAWLRQQTDQSKGPLLVTRSGVPDTTVTMDLRNVPLSEAIRTIAILADLEVDWHPWGAGLRLPEPPPAPTNVPAPTSTSGPAAKGSAL